MTPAALQTAARLRAARSLGFAARRRRVPRARFPRLIESDYAARLVGIVDQMRAVGDRLLRTALEGLPGYRTDETAASRARRIVESARAQIEDATNTTRLEGVAADFGRRTAEHQKAELLRQGRAALGIELVVLDPTLPSLLDGFVHENVSLIRKLRGATLDELEAIITRAHASGTRAEAVSAEIAARYGIAERHARLIARDQIGKLTSQVTAVRHQEIGIASFVWRSSGDQRVRPRHAQLNGTRWRYDKPPPEGLPGQPVMCRCSQEPVFDDLLALAGDTPRVVVPFQRRMA